MTEGSAPNTLPGARRGGARARTLRGGAAAGPGGHRRQAENGPLLAAVHLVQDKKTPHIPRPKAGGTYSSDSTANRFPQFQASRHLALNSYLVF
jgi:hypothetical protein